MSKTSKNPMSEDELLSALGFSTEEPKAKSGKPAVIDGDILIDILAPESKPARKARVTSERERAREEQEREKSLRSKEWKRELEQQRMRAAALAPDEDDEVDARPMRSESQPAIPNVNDMRDIGDAALAAEEKRRAADEIERRRLAMQEQVRRRQEEVAAEAQAAAEAARRRAQEQEAQRQGATAPLTLQQRSQGRRPHPAQNEPEPALSQSQRFAQQPRPASQQGRGSAQPSRANSQPIRPAGQQPVRASQAPARNPRPTDERMRQRPQGFSQDLGNPQPMQQNAPRQEAPAVPPAASYQAPPQQVERPRSKNEAPPARNPNRVPPQSKESPLGIVLIVLAVLCVLVAASLLTGLWDISNL